MGANHGGYVYRPQVTARRKMLNLFFQCLGGGGGIGMDNGQLLNRRDSFQQGDDPFYSTPGSAGAFG